MSIVPLPGVLRIEPASACNFKCRHCPTGLDLNPNIGIMTMETFEKIYARISKHRFRVIVPYHGGEPLLNKNFFVMAKRLKSLCGFMKTTTNGSALTENNIDKLLDCGVDLVIISLDGNSIAENDQIRVRADGKKILNSLKVLIQKKIETRNPLQIRVSGIIIPDSIEEIKNPPKTPAYITEFLGDLCGFIEIKMQYSQIWPGMIPLIPLKQPKPSNNFCDNVESTITIRWDGTVVPCCYDLTTISPMGNILDEDLESIWNNDKYRKLREGINSFNPPILCQGCVELYPQNYMVKQDIKIT
ncbi:MAG: radical SAM protein [Patescibacteria group bacterium]